jgi:hypothetical protein
MVGGRSHGKRRSRKDRERGSDKKPVPGRCIAKIEEGALPGLKAAIVGHSIADDMRSLCSSVRDMSEGMNLVQLAMLWLTPRGLNFFRFRKEVLPDLKALSPDLIFLQIAGNDLDGPDSAEMLARRYLYQASALFGGSIKAKVVILGEALPRSGPKNVSAAVYASKAAEFNQRLRSALVRPNASSRGQVHPSRFVDKKVWFWTHERLGAFPRFKSGSGVHLARASLRDLYYSIRAALREAYRPIWHL